MIDCANVFGEIHADGRTLVIIAQGELHQIQNAAGLLEDATALFTDSAKSLKVDGGLTTGLAWPTVVQLASIFRERWSAGPYLTEWVNEQLRRRTLQQQELWVPPPPGLTPRSYQVHAAAMIREVGGVLLWDDPGTGKTISTILGLVERAAQGHPVLPVIVVCPASVVDPWVEEAQKWAPFWRTIAWHGSPARRRRLMGTADIYVASYGTAVRDAPGQTDRDGKRIKSRPLMELGACAVVGDEMHMLKTQSSARSTAARRLAEAAVGRGGLFVGLSGTPITHNPGDAFPSLNALDPVAYPSRDRWVTRYCHFQRQDYGVKALGLAEAREGEFRNTLLGQSRRVAKADVASELPPKVHVQRYVDIPEPWRTAYDRMAEDMLTELPDSGELEVMSVLSQLTRLSQLASSAANVEHTTEHVFDHDLGLWVDRPHVNVTLKRPCWKADELMEVMAERPGRPVVCFAGNPGSRQLVDLAADMARERGYRVGMIVGGQSKTERTANRQAFQAGQLDLICVTTGAGGVGITLTRSDCAVFLARPFSLVEATQAEDRLHRIGAEGHESIEVIDIIARNAIDERVRNILKLRAGQLADFVKDPRIVAEILGGASVTPLRKAS